MLRRAAVLALVWSALVGCSSGGDDAPSDAAAGRSASSGSPVATGSVAGAQQLTVAQLKDTLPTSSDLPAIFSPTEDNTARGKRTTFLCGADLQFDQRNATAGVGYGAQGGLSAQRLTLDISQFDSPEVAAKRFQAFADAVGSCHRYTSDGDTYTVAPVSAGRVGDDTVAVEVTARSAGFAVAVDVIVVRTGPALLASLSATIGLAGSTLDDLVRLTDATVDRYESAAGIS